MKAVVIRQRQSSDLPDKRDCRHVPKCIQAPDIQKLFLITRFISFLAPPPSSTLANVLEGRAQPKSIPGVQGNPESLFRSRIHARKQNRPLGPAAKFSCSVPQNSSNLPPETSGKWPERGNMGMKVPAGKLVHVRLFQQPWQVKAHEADPRLRDGTMAVHYLPCNDDYMKDS